MCKSTVVLVLISVIAAAVAYGDDDNCTSAGLGSPTPYKRTYHVNTYPNSCDSEFQGNDACGDSQFNGSYAYICDPNSSGPDLTLNSEPPLLIVNRIPDEDSYPPCAKSASGTLTIYCSGPIDENKY